MNSLYRKDDIYLKGVFFKYEGKYYPIKIILLPVSSKESYNLLKIFDYDDFLFIDGVLSDINNPFESIINGLSNETLSFLHFPTINNDLQRNIIQNIIPQLPTFERKLNENQDYKDNFLKQLGHYGSIREEETFIIREKCSYPLLSFKKYPSETHLYSLKIDNKIEAAVREKFNRQEPLIPFKEGELFPDYYSAAKYYLGKENFLLNDWSAVFSRLDFRARINKIIIKRDGVEVEIEKNIDFEINVKYYLEYGNGQQKVDNISCSEKKCSIPINNSLIKLSVWIFDNRDPKTIIDYRNYDWNFYFIDPLREYSSTDYETSNLDLMFSGESEIVEYKMDLDKNNGNKEFLETVCSFSNSKGGYIFVGIDDNMNCKGIDETKITNYKQSIEDSIRSKMDPQPVNFDIKERNRNDKKILEVYVREGNNKPYCVKERGYYIRVRGTDRMPTHNEIISLMPKEDIHNPNI